MIIERKPKIDLSDLKEQYGELIKRLENNDISDSIVNFAKLIQVYNG